jgi:hypothetical protein
LPGVFFKVFDKPVLSCIMMDVEQNVSKSTLRFNQCSFKRSDEQTSFSMVHLIVGLRITNEKSGKLRSDKMINKDFLFF